MELNQKLVLLNKYYNGYFIFDILYIFEYFM